MCSLSSAIWEPWWGNSLEQVCFWASNLWWRIRNHGKICLENQGLWSERDYLSRAGLLSSLWYCASGEEDGPCLRVMSLRSGEFMTWSRGKGWKERNVFLLLLYPQIQRCSSFGKWTSTLCIVTATSPCPCLGGFWCFYDDIYIFICPALGPNPSWAELKLAGTSGPPHHPALCCEFCTQVKRHSQILSSQIMVTTAVLMTKCTIYLAHFY